MSIQTTETITECEVSIVVHRANGDIEDLGVIESYKQGRIKRLLNKISKIKETT